MSESPDRPELHSFAFNRSVKLRQESPNITSNAGVLLLREVDDKLGITCSIAQDISDIRNQSYVRYSIEDLLRERVYAFALGYTNQDDADIIAHDPAFKMAVWGNSGVAPIDQRIASQPTQSRLLNTLSLYHSKEALRDHLLTPMLRHQRQGGGDRKVRLGVVDIDGFPVETFGKQQGAEYNGYYGKTIYSPLVACFSVAGTLDAVRMGEGFLHAILRNGNAAPAEDAELFLDATIDKASQLAQTVAIRADAAFANARILNQLDARGVRFAMRLPSNQALERIAQPYLTRPTGRPCKGGYEFTIELNGYCDPQWSKNYRVVLVVVDKPDKNGRLSLFPHHFFIVANWPEQRFSGRELLTHYRQRGTFEDRLGEWNAMNVNLSQDSFQKNEANLLLSLLAFNYAEILRSEMEDANDPRSNPPASPEASGFDMTRFRDIMLKVGGKFARGSRRLYLDIAEGIAPLWMALLARIKKLRPVEKKKHPTVAAFGPLPSHAYQKYTPRM